jgi:hypothetical protein
VTIPLKRASFLPCVAFVLTAGAMIAQTSESWRRSFPEPNATIRESLLRALFPGADLKWSPNLTVEIAGIGPQEVQFAGFTFLPSDDGNLNGATGIDLGASKDDYIFKSRNLHHDGSQSFPADLIVFRATRSGQVLAVKKFSLDPSDELTKIKSIQLSKWPGAPSFVF